MASPAPKEIKILVVEDEKALQEVLVELFKVFGFSVESADDGEQALQKINNISFDLVLTDLRMPKMSGVDLLKDIKRHNPQFPRVFIISGFTDYTIDDLLNWGADGFFSKPFDSTAVRKALKEALLDPKQRWSQRPRGPIAHEIRKRYKNLSEGLRTKEFALGRCGFFVHGKHEKPEPGQLVNFQIEFIDGIPNKRIEGIGQVVWSREFSESGKNSGYGVEFLYLEPSCVDPFLKWTEATKTIAYVPIL